MKVSVILPAAGVGKRFQGDESIKGSKVEVSLAGRPVFQRTIELFAKQPDVIEILLAVNPDGIDDFRFRWSDKLNFHGVRLIEGGSKERWETVQIALAAISDEATHVAVHDVVRPLATRKLISAVFDAAAKHAAVIPALPVNNTLKRVAPAELDTEDDDPIARVLGGESSAEAEMSRVIETVDRSNLVEVQTPQVFERSLLERAYQQIVEGKVDSANITDDAGLVEALGETVYTVPGEVTNLKITRPGDFHLAKAIVGKMEKTDQVELARRRLFGDDDD